MLAGLDLRHQSGFDGAIPYSPYSPLEGQYGGTYGTQPITAVPTTQTVTAIAGTTSQAQLGFDWKATSRLSLAASRLQDFGGVGSVTSPTETNAQASYRLGNSGSVYVRQLWASAPTVSFASASLGLAQSSQATRSTVVGFERDIDQSTSIDSEYVVDRTVNGTDAYAAFGVRQKVAIAKNIKGDAFLQAGNAAGGLASGFTVFGANLSYANGNRLHATASVQDRTGGFGGATLNFGIAGALSTEFSVLGTFNESNFAGFDYSDARFGLAWRPSGNQRGAGLLGFERAGGAIDTATAGHGDVLSYDQVYRPTGKLELAGRFAYKVDGDSYYSPPTRRCNAFRSTQRLGPRLDIGGEWHWLTQPGLAGTEQSSFATELGYRLGSAFRIAGGYNFDGSADPSLVGTPVTSRSVRIRELGSRPRVRVGRALDCANRCAGSALKATRSPRDRSSFSHGARHTFSSSCCWALFCRAQRRRNRRRWLPKRLRAHRRCPASSSVTAARALPRAALRRRHQTRFNRAQQMRSTPSAAAFYG